MISDARSGRSAESDGSPVVVLTGAGSGIGRATADVFAERGARLVLVGRRAALLEDAARAALKRGAEALAMPRDLRHPDAAAEIVDAAVGRFSRIDVVVNNAGVAGEGIPLHEVSDELWDEIVGTNLTAVHRMLRATLPLFIRQRGGVALNVASTAAFKSMAHMAAYAASKAAVVALTKAVARDYARFGIRCNAVCPGTTDTPMTANLLSEAERYASVVRAIPMGRIARPREVAEIVVSLCGAESSYMTGAVVVVDGGQSCT